MDSVVAGVPVHALLADGNDTEGDERWQGLGCDAR
jgi:hypothetical protein